MSNNKTPLEEAAEKYVMIALSAFGGTEQEYNDNKYSIERSFIAGAQWRQQNRVDVEFDQKYYSKKACAKIREVFSETFDIKHPTKGKIDYSDDNVLIEEFKDEWTWYMCACKENHDRIQQQQGDEWISVEEQKPINDTQVLIWPHHQNSPSAFYGNRISDKPTFYLYGATIHTVKYWKQLPQPPKQKEGGGR